jgi:hypothetical protein
MLVSVKETRVNETPLKETDGAPRTGTGLNSTPTTVIWLFVEFTVALLMEMEDGCPQRLRGSRNANMQVAKAPCIPLSCRMWGVIFTVFSFREADSRYEKHKPA